MVTILVFVLKKEYKMTASSANVPTALVFRLREDIVLKEQCRQMDDFDCDRIRQDI